MALGHRRTPGDATLHRVSPDGRRKAAFGALGPNGVWFKVQLALHVRSLARHVACIRLRIVPKDLGRVNAPREPPAHQLRAHTQTTSTFDPSVGAWDPSHLRPYEPNQPRLEAGRHQETALGRP